jgi:SAM-dependent methyltransferase
LSGLKPDAEQVRQENIEDKIAKLIQEKGGIRLDLACGAFKKPGWCGLDMFDFPGVDIIWDLNVHPYPFPDECCVQIIGSHIVEHIPPVAFIDGKTHFLFMEFMDELWRIMKPEGQLAISYPHGNSQSFLQDPTHTHAMNEAVWMYFDPLEANTKGHLYHIYNPLPWKLESLNWSPEAYVEVLMTKRRMDRSYTNE